MIKPETDIEMIGRIYREQMAVTKQDWQAYQACLKAWRKRYPAEGARAAREIVGQLITNAAAVGLISPNSRWWDS
jgi:hypothetical protein